MKILWQAGGSCPLWLLVSSSFLSLSAHLGFQSPGWRPIAGLIAMLASNITRHSAVILSNNRALCYRAVQLLCSPVAPVVFSPFFLKKNYDPVAGFIAPSFILWFFTFFVIIHTKKKKERKFLRRTSLF